MARISLYCDVRTPGLAAWPGIESTSVLIELLQRRGTPEMAEDFLNARDPGLHEPAEEWARKHKYTIAPGKLKR